MAVELTLRGPSTRPSAPRATLVEQTAALARRAIVRTLRQRALLVFPMVFPLILFAINGSALSPATTTYVRHEPRLSGRSNYTLRMLVRHAVNMLTGFSVRPLKLASLMADPALGLILVEGCALTAGISCFASFH